MVYLLQLFYFFHLSVLVSDQFSLSVWQRPLIVSLQLPPWNHIIPLKLQNGTATLRLGFCRRAQQWKWAGSKSDDGERKRSSTSGTCDVTDKNTSNIRRWSVSYDRRKSCFTDRTATTVGPYPSMDKCHGHLDAFPIFSFKVIDLSPANALLSITEYQQITKVLRLSINIHNKHDEPFAYIPKPPL